MASRQSLAPVWANEWIQGLLGELINVTPTGLTFVGGDVHLFTGATVPTVDNVAADFTEPTFTGYAAVNMATLFRNPVSPQLNTIFFNAVIQRTGGAISDTVTGYYVVTATGELVLAERFVEAVSFNVVGALLDLGIYFPYPMLTTVPGQ